MQVDCYNMAKLLGVERTLGEFYAVEQLEFVPFLHSLFLSASFVYIESNQVFWPTRYIVYQNSKHVLIMLLELYESPIVLHKLIYSIILATVLAD